MEFIKFKTYYKIQLFYALFVELIIILINTLISSFPFLRLSFLFLPATEMQDI